MSVRSINCPGVEIHEIDRSMYTPAMVGSAALVCGFSTKGQLYKPMQFTSRAAWLNFYGEPDNEAERYFYNACMEVINQGGVLYSARIPYENEAREKMVAKKYKVACKERNISSVYEDYLASKNFLGTTGNIDDADDIACLIAGNFSKYGWNTKIDDDAQAALNIATYYNTLNLYNERIHLNSVAFRLLYSKTETDADSDWLYYPQTSILDRLTALFDKNSDFRRKFDSLQTDFPATELSDDVETPTVHADLSNLTEFDFSMFDSYLEKMGTDADGIPYSSATATPEMMVSAYIAAYEDTFGDIANDYTPWNFNWSDFGYDTTQAIYKFYKQNEENFKFLQRVAPRKELDPELSDLTGDDDKPYLFDEYFSCQTPWFWAESKVEEDTTQTILQNMMSYYTAATNIFKSNSVASSINLVETINQVIKIHWWLANSDLGAKAKMEDEVYSKLYDDRFDPLMAGQFVGTGTEYRYYGCNGLNNKLWKPEDLPSLTPIINEKVTALVGVLARIIKNDKFQEIIAKLTFDTFEDTKFAKFLLEEYQTRTNITGTWDFINIKNASDIGVFYYTIDDTKTVDEEGVEANSLDEIISDGKAVLFDKTPFDKYDTMLEVDGEEITLTEYTKSLGKSNRFHVFVDYCLKMVTKPMLMSYLNEIKEVKRITDVGLYLSDKADDEGDVYNLEEGDYEYIWHENYTFKQPNYKPGTREIDPDDPYTLVENYTGYVQQSLQRATSKIRQYFEEDVIASKLAWSEIKSYDPNIAQYFRIISETTPFLVDLSAVAEYEADESKVPTNSFYIIDKTGGVYEKVIDRKGKEHECIGIIPVVTTAANALVAQSIIETYKGDAGYGQYQALSCVETLNFDTWKYRASKKTKEKTLSTVIDQDFESAMEFYNADPEADETVSDWAASQFPSIPTEDNGLDRENLKKIGIVVCKAYLDAAEGNKISYDIVESFVGELDCDAINENTGVTTFIDTIVNTQSDYIYCFSNCFNSEKYKRVYKDVVDILTIEPQHAASLGFYEDMVVEDISLTKSIFDGLRKIYDKISDINQCDLDIVCDAGISNIAQYIKSVYGGGGKGPYDPACTEASMYKLKNRASISTWKTILLDYYDVFCKKTRKDCMFIADGPRPFCLTGNKKIIRDTKPANTIDANLLPYVNYMTGINTNYGAGYCDWFQVTDEFTGEYFWCPPSIKAMGVYINTDLNFEYWDAPAGLNRGVIPALDCAFSPTMAQAGAIYDKNWNYAINYPKDGIVLEGQKTFQVKPSAFDRVNVRRLFLRLERQTYKVARYFVYEGNTAYTRQKLVDTLDPIFKEAKNGGGLYDYKIVCDESINTPDVIDRNELRVKIGLKPVKTAEFLILDFIALRTGASFQEMF